MCTPQSLPMELVVETLTSVIQDEPRCAYGQFVLEWKLCTRCSQAQGRFGRTSGTRPPGEVRYDVFDMAERGQVARVATHDDHECVRYPVLQDLRGKHLFSRFVDEELTKRWADLGLFVFGQQLTHLGHAQDPDLQPRLRAAAADAGHVLADPRARDALPYEDDDPARLAGLARLPALTAASGRAGERQFLHRRVRHLVLNSRLALMRLGTPAVLVCPRPGDDGAAVDPVVLRNRRLAGRLLDRDRVAHWRVALARLDRLETLYLDLREFSRACGRRRGGGRGRGRGRGRSRDAAALAAFAMLLAGLQRRPGPGLRLLVVAGVRSYAGGLWGGWAPLTAGEVARRWAAARALRLATEGGPEPEDWARWCALYEEEPQVLAWKALQVFAQAVRPGGRLVLVDKPRD